jgi:hypothetical protein
VVCRVAFVQGTEMTEERLPAQTVEAAFRDPLSGGCVPDWHGPTVRAAPVVACMSALLPAFYCAAACQHIMTFRV